MKLLSVTVPCYNSQDYMKNCIESLLPGGEKLEIILIDDGSTDNTGRIADEYAARYPDIVKVIHQENGGHGEGINQGLKAATGTYFKVVDSDDTLSGDFPAFLAQLEECERAGGVDLMVTNYYYVHSDGVGDRSIRYASVLPEGDIFTWAQTKPFMIHQMLTIHSCTFRTEAMRQWGCQLPKHTFYEDNLMVYLTLPYIKRMYYMDVDLYRYWIGRPDQSVQHSILIKRYAHQILVTKSCFTAGHLDQITEPRLKKYMKHELFMLLGMAVLFTRQNPDPEAETAHEEMWSECRAYDAKWADHFRKGTPLWFICLPGKLGRGIAKLVYQAANKIVRFN